MKTNVLRHLALALAGLVATLSAGCAEPEHFDLLITNGVVVDGGLRPLHLPRARRPGRRHGAVDDSAGVSDARRAPFRRLPIQRRECIRCDAAVMPTVATRQPPRAHKTPDSMHVGLR